MAFPLDNSERRVIPRWRDSRTTAALGELDSAGQEPSAPVDDTLVAQKALEWADNHSVSFASDLLATALSSGLQPTAGYEAAEFLLASKDASPAAKVIARRFLGLTQPKTDLLELYPDTNGTLPVQARHRRIHLLRQQLADSPRNVLLRADLALEYTAVGRRDKALEMMDLALRLNPENRFLLRSAARLLVHVNAADSALAMLRSSAVTKQDPWLIAAEIAISGVAEKGPRFAKIGGQILQGERFSNFHITELASALGTLEAEAGARKKAKRLFQQSLIDPTENSVAQATWAVQQREFDGFDPQLLQLPGSFEARALDSRRLGEVHTALSETWKWLGDQSFAPTAAIFGSYLASVAIEDYEQALRFVDVGTRANQNEWLLLNNRAFSLASLDRIDEAEEVLDSLPKTPSDPVRVATVLATRGLILFRRGLTMAARELYLAAVAAFRHANEGRGAAIALLFWAREEIIANTSRAEAALKAAQEAVSPLGDSVDSTELLMALRRIEQHFEALQAFKPR